MGRKLPPFSPAEASTETVAGRKRKGASLAPLALSKRRARATGGWASLPTDIIGLVLRWLVAGGGGGDIVDYIAFRAVCFGWRDCTPTLRDPTLRDPRLRPRNWVALCDGDAVRPDDACEIPFFHQRTARRIRVHLPELRCYRIVGFTDGLVILLHKSSTAVRVLHPFTRVTVDFPPLAPVYREEVGQKKHLLQMNAVVCGSANSENSIAVVVWFPWTREVLAAEPVADSDWKVLHRGPFVRSMLPFQGKLYATFLASREIVQLYPPPLDDSPVVVARIPDIFGKIMFCEFFLVESAGLMLLAVLYPSGHRRNVDWSRHVSFKLYAVQLRSSSIAKLIRVSSLGDHALFLNLDRCLSVSARSLPSVRSNSIYFSLSDSPVVLHSLRTGLSEQLSEHCQIHDMVDRIRPSVRPFTIIDHLLTYCHHREWAEGLMFHEYHHIPESFKELRKDIQSKNSQLRIPRLRDQ